MSADSASYRLRRTFTLALASGYSRPISSRGQVFNNLEVEGILMEVSEKASRRSMIRSFFASVAAAGAGMFGVAHAQTKPVEMVKRTSTDNQPAGDKPPMFSNWVTYGNLVFIAGKGEHTPGDITAHTTAVLNLLEAELKNAGSSMDKVLKVNVYLHDMRDFEAMNAVYRGRFGPNPPVRTTVAVHAGIPGSSLVEIDCIATR
jgi:2-iminobutanoate/2-iminopropanoate deaminase